MPQRYESRQQAEAKSLHQQKGLLLTSTEHLAAIEAYLASLPAKTLFTAQQLLELVRSKKAEAAQQLQLLRAKQLEVQHRLSDHLRAEASAARELMTAAGETAPMQLLRRARDQVQATQRESNAAIRQARQQVTQRVTAVARRAGQTPPARLAYAAHERTSTALTVARGSVDRRARRVAGIISDQTLGRLTRSSAYRYAAFIGQAVMGDIRVALALHRASYSMDPASQAHVSSYITSCASSYSLSPLPPASSRLQAYVWRARRLVYAVARFTGQSRRHVFGRRVRHWPVDSLTLLFQLLLVYLPSKHKEYEPVRESMMECLRWYESSRRNSPQAAEEDRQQQQAYLMDPHAMTMSLDASFVAEISAASSETPPVSLTNVMLNQSHSLFRPANLYSPIPFESAQSSSPLTLSTPAGNQGGRSLYGISPQLMAPRSSPRWRSGMPSSASHLRPHHSPTESESNFSVAESVGTSHAHAAYERALQLLAREGIDVRDVDLSETSDWDEEDWDIQSAKDVRFQHEYPASDVGGSRASSVFEGGMEDRSVSPAVFTTTQAPHHDHSYSTPSFSSLMAATSAALSAHDTVVSTIPESPVQDLSRVVESPMQQGQTAEDEEADTVLDTPILDAIDRMTTDEADRLTLQPLDTNQPLSSPSTLSSPAEAGGEPGEAGESLLANACDATPEGKRSTRVNRSAQVEVAHAAKLIVPIQIHSNPKLNSSACEILSQLQALLRERCESHEIVVESLNGTLEWSPEQHSTASMSADSVRKISLPVRATTDDDDQSSLPLHLILHSLSSESNLDDLLRLIQSIQLPEKVVRASSFFLVLLHSGATRVHEESTLASLKPFAGRSAILHSMLSTGQVTVHSSSSSTSDLAERSSLVQLADRVMHVVEMDVRDLTEGARV